MVKRSGTKRKAKMEKITNKGSLATTFTKRTYGLFSKVSQLCLLSDAQIAVLLTPSSSNSNVNFYSFGHSSVDSVVNAYLTGERPVREETTREDDEDIAICMARKELGLDLWWEDHRLLQSAANPDELAQKISRMLIKIKELRSQAHHDEPLKNNNETMKQTVSADQTLILPSDSNLNNMNGEQDKTLNFQSNSHVCCNPILMDDDDDEPLKNNNETMKQTESTDQTLILPSASNLNNIDGEQDKTLNFQSNSQVSSNPILMDDDDDFLPADCNNVMPEEHDQIMANCDTSSDPEIDVDQLVFSDSDLDITVDSSLFDAVFLDTTTTHEHDELDKATTNSATVACDDALLDTATTHEHELEDTTNSATIACDDDASAERNLDEENLMFSDYLTKLLQA